MRVTFGDGVQRRAPADRAGQRRRRATAAASARTARSAPARLTMLRAMPLGLRGVTNPIAAGGAEGPEQLADARRNAPLTVLTFERVVSLLDYENYARAYPGHRQGARRRAVDRRRVARASDGGRRDRRRCRAPTCSTNLRDVDRRRQRSVAAVRRRRFAQRYFTLERADRRRSALSLRRRAGGGRGRAAARRSASTRASSASR